MDPEDHELLEVDDGNMEECESALFLEPKITSSLCDAVGSEDEKQTRTLTNGKDRHHN